MLHSAAFRVRVSHDKNYMETLLICPRSNAIIQAGNYADPPKFYDYLLNKVAINFSERNPADTDDGHFTLELSKKMSYDQIVAKVGEYLKADPTHIRLSTVAASNNRPRGYVKKLQNQTLSTILSGAYGYSMSTQSQRNDWLLYEVLELSLSELESKRLVKITMLSDGITKEVTWEYSEVYIWILIKALQDVFDVLVPKNGTVSDIYAPLQKKAKISDEVVQNIRFYEVHSSRVYKELGRDNSVASFNEFVTIYAEQIPQDEIEADENTDKAVYAFHFDKDASKAHGVPFKFVVKPVRDRLVHQTGHQLTSTE